jgi:hypothetical protein
VQWFDQLQATPVEVGMLAASYATNAPANWQPDQTQSFTTTVTNTGSVTWNAADPQGVHLGVYFDGSSDNIYDWQTEPVRFSLPNDVAPGGSATIVVTATAPTAPGNYVLRQRMVKEFVGWFSQLQKTNVVVTSTPPTVTAGTPANGAVSVLTDSAVTVTLSGAIDPATINASDFVLIRRGTTTPIAATIRFDATTGQAVLQPSAYLLTNTTYTATIKGGASGVRNLAGISLATDRTWSFTTTSTPADASRIISQSVPSSMVAGRTYSISITVQNTGTSAWDAGSYSLGFPRNNTAWALNRVALPASVAPGARVTFKFTVRAPQTTGYYNFQWQMVKGQAAWFGALTPNVRIWVRR